jgi:hypothetical protein
MVDFIKLYQFLEEEKKHPREGLTLNQMLRDLKISDVMLLYPGRLPGCYTGPSWCISSTYINFWKKKKASKGGPDSVPNAERSENL